MRKCVIVRAFIGLIEGVRRIIGKHRKNIMFSRPLILSFLLIGAAAFSYIVEVFVDYNQLPNWASFIILLLIGVTTYYIFSICILNYIKKSKPDFDLDNEENIEWLKRIPAGIVPVWFSYMNLVAYSILIASIFSIIKYYLIS